MKKIITITLLAFAMGPFFSEDSLAQSQNIEGNFIHAVYFWLKNPDSKTDREKFEKSLTNFIQNSENITGKHIGLPAKTDRDVIENSYTYSLVLSFKNKEMQDKYQVEPGHLKFIEECKDLWNKVIVYDSENMLK